MFDAEYYLLRIVLREHDAQKYIRNSNPTMHDRRLRQLTSRFDIPGKNA